MKILKLNEYTSLYDDFLEKSIQIVKDICLDLEDEGYIVSVNAESIIPSWLSKGEITKHREQKITIEISKSGYFDYKDIKDTIDRLVLVLYKPKYIDDKFSKRSGFKLYNYPMLLPEYINNYDKSTRN